MTVGGKKPERAHVGRQQTRPSCGPGAACGAPGIRALLGHQSKIRGAECSIQINLISTNWKDKKEMKGTAESLDENRLISESVHPGRTDSSSAE